MYWDSINVSIFHECFDFFCLFELVLGLNVEAQYADSQCDSSADIPPPTDECI